MSTRVKLVVKNNTGVVVECTNIHYERFENLSEGHTIAPGGENEYTTETSDRIFCTFTEQSPGAGSWQLAMTCPISSRNSACGSYNAGLQPYERRGTPVTFTFILGQPNEADWNHGDISTNMLQDVIRYADCS